MKISVSLPEADVTFVDAYGRERGFASRSSVIHAAIALLRRRVPVADEYAAADEEWRGSGEADLWDTVAGDGIGG